MQDWAKVKVLKDQLKTQAEKIVILTEALEFYGDKDSWQRNDGSRNSRIMGNDVDHLYFFRCESSYYGGKRARAALKQIQEMGGE